MPVDYFIVIIPIVFLISIFIPFFVISKKIKNIAHIMAFILVMLFIGIYLMPAWLLMPSAYSGNAQAELKLGYYYWDRFGNLGSNFEERDKWFLRSANHGNVYAMELVGQSYFYGSSSVIPKDASKANYWFNEAVKAGAPDRVEILKLLSK